MARVAKTWAEYLAYLKKENHAYCPFHKKPFALPYNKTENAGREMACSICQRQIDKQDAAVMRLVSESNKWS